MLFGTAYSGTMSSRCSKQWCDVGVFFLSRSRLLQSCWKREPKARQNHLKGRSQIGDFFFSNHIFCWPFFFRKKGFWALLWLYFVSCCGILIRFVSKAVFFWHMAIDRHARFGSFQTTFCERQDEGWLGSPSLGQHLHHEPPTTHGKIKVLAT